LPLFLAADTEWTTATNRVCIVPFNPGAEAATMPRFACLHWMNDTLARSSILVYPAPSQEWIGSGSLDELSSALQTQVRFSFGYVMYAAWRDRVCCTGAHFGIPLLTEPLNEEVCKKVIAGVEGDGDFFAPERIKGHAEEMRDLETRFLSFISGPVCGASSKGAVMRMLYSQHAQPGMMS
jgi:hypothetical protein